VTYALESVSNREVETIRLSVASVQIDQDRGIRLLLLRSLSRAKPANLPERLESMKTRCPWNEKSNIFDKRDLDFVRLGLEESAERADARAARPLGTGALGLFSARNGFLFRIHQGIKHLRSQ
jgi:hypothetical protein